MTYLLLLLLWCCYAIIDTLCHIIFTRYIMTYIIIVHAKMLYMILCYIHIIRLYIIYILLLPTWYHTYYAAAIHPLLHYIISCYDYFRYYVHAMPLCHVILYPYIKHLYTSSIYREPDYIHLWDLHVPTHMLLTMPIVFVHYVHLLLHINYITYTYIYLYIIRAAKRAEKRDIIARYMSAMLCSDLR